MTARVVHVREVPAAIRALATPHDYVDLFVATTPLATQATPEQWARAAIEGAPAAGRFLAWRAICHLHLAEADEANHIGGWRIANRGHDWIRVAAPGRFMSAQMVFHVARHEVSFATYLHYDRAAAVPVWRAASVVHRAAAPGFLGAAVRRIEHLQAVR